MIVVIGVGAGFAGFVFGVLFHNRIVREDLKLAEMAKRIVAAKVAAVKAAEMKAALLAKDAAVKVEAEIKKI